MHLKNYSLIKHDNIWKLAPAYDFLSTTIALQYPEEESALPINGRKNKFRREDLVDYLAIDHLKLTPKIVGAIMAELEAQRYTFIDLIARSYLTEQMKDAYVKVLNERYDRLYNV
jgi:serine/threonine-protein kinase HipA